MTQAEGAREAEMNPRRPIGDRRSGRFLMQVLWPSFLMAVVAMGVFFSIVDPLELTIVARYLGDSRDAAYTIGFFVFWGLLAASSTITWLLLDSPPAARLEIDEGVQRPRDKPTGTTFPDPGAAGYHRRRKD
jgi:hypothetical protein